MQTNVKENWDTSREKFTPKLNVNGNESTFTPNLNIIKKKIIFTPNHGLNFHGRRGHSQNWAHHSRGARLTVTPVLGLAT